MTRKLILSFSADASDRPLIYDLIRIYDIRINIIKAEIQPGKTGSLLAEFDADETRIGHAVAYLNGCGVEVNPVSSRVSYDKSGCMDCGNCASACFSQALTIASPDWKLNFDTEKCIACKLCLKACPLKLFRIEFDGMER